MNAVTDTVLDLSSAIPVDSAFLEIMYPGVEPPKSTGWKIELAGPAHPKAVSLGNEIMRERLHKAAEIEAKQVNGRKHKPEEDTPDEVARRNVTRIVQRILGWSPDPLFKSISDKPLVFSEKGAVDLLLRPDMGWVLEQIADFLRNDASFTQTSAKV